MSMPGSHCKSDRGVLNNSETLRCAVRREALPPQWLSVALRLCVAICALTNLLLFNAHAEEEVKIWEFSPYEVEVWYSFDPSLDISEFAKSRLIADLQNDIERTFRATWRVQLTEANPVVRNLIDRSLDVLKVQDLTSEDLVLMVSKDSANASVRTFDAAVEKIEEFSITAEQLAKLQAATADLPESEKESSIGRMLAKLKPIEGGIPEIIEGMKEKKIACVLVPTSSMKQLEPVARSVMTMLPWQTASLLRQRDKLFLAHFGADEVGFNVRVREIDCPMQFVGPVMHREAITWTQVHRAATSALVAAFAPVARVEDAESKSAMLRLRAGGLIMSLDNPSAVVPGDLMQPIVRRDDRNGQPSLLEPLSWTYACVTESDGIKMEANVYSYSGGPGLEGRKNRRTQRVLLKVRPLFDQTDILVIVRGTDKPQGGCAVYQRDLATEELTLLGRTDWRGRLAVTVPNELGSVLPEEVRAAQAAAKKAAEEAADQAEAETAAASSDPNAPAEEQPASAPAADVPATAANEVAPNTLSAEAIPLRHPLMQLYIKSGDIVLARLPLVPGLKQVEIAQLPDDTRRLEAEAFMRGFQGEILDLIGLRSLLSARIKLLVKDRKLPEAEKLLVELRGLKDYSAMADSLDGLQRKMLDETAGPITRGTQMRIDNMFQATREMLQKFLQNDLVREAETVVSQALKSGPAPASSVPENSAPSNAAPDGNATAASASPAT